MSVKFDNIRVTPLKGTGNMKAYGKVELFGAIDVSYRVMDGQKGIFVGWPARQSAKPGENGQKKWYNEVYFLQEEDRQTVDKAILAEYNQAAGNREEAAPSSRRSSSNQRQENAPPF